MTVQSSQYFESYIPDYSATPEKWEDARSFLVEQLKKISTLMNDREIGFFLDIESLTGQSFVPSTANNQVFRSVFRYVVNFGILPNSTTKSVAHGLTVDDNFTIVNMYLAATDPVNFTGFSLQYYSLNASDSIRLNYDATNVNVITTQDYRAYTTSYIILEYLLEV